MESARDKTTNEIVEAEDLWLLDKVDTGGYVCWGCGIDMYPSSWKKENKKRPSFNKKPRQEHLAGCDADAEREIVENGRKGSVQKALESAPALSPSGLKLVDARSSIGSGEKYSSSATQTGSLVKERKGADAPDSQQKKTRRPAQTIRPICRAFIRFPHDRHMSLSIPRIDGDKYLNVFKKLSAPIQAYPFKKLFYSQLLWQLDRYNEEELVVALSGEWGKDNRPSKSYQIHVKWKRWSKNRKTLLLNEIEVAREEAKLARKEGRRDRAWLFFLGTQRIHDNDVFYVEDGRMICALVGDIIYPKFKPKAIA